MTDPFREFRERQERETRRFNRFFGVWFAFCVLLALATTGGTLFVAIHFLQKVW